MNWTIFYRWVLANFLGGIVGYLTELLLALLLGDFNLFSGAAMGAIIGFAQWQVLSAYLAEMRPLRWVALTALGYAASLPIFSYLGYAVAYTTGLQTGGDPVQGWINLASTRGPNGPVEAMLALVEAFPSALLGAAGIGALTGLIIGATQVVVLRQYVPWAYRRWLPANAVAGIIGTVAAIYVSMGVYNGLYDNTALFIVGVALSPVGLSILGSVVTGFALARLVARNSKR